MENRYRTETIKMAVVAPTNVLPGQNTHYQQSGCQWALASICRYRASCCSPLKAAVYISGLLRDQLHWVPQCVLFLPKIQGDQGLIHLPSRVSALRLQFAQRLLYESDNVVWKPLFFVVLRTTE